ncbi:MAG: hypothetical protein CMO80_18060 [Verrucomicrobiales bacterium]|nr:hypothetical protein [Verrucomicrobiales bacterium]
MKKLTRFLLAGSAGIALCANAAISKDQLIFFETKIRPVLANNCFKCHSASQKVKGGLTVDSASGLLDGGDSGPAIRPGDPQGSLLYRALTYKDPDVEMPPNAKLPDDVIANFEQWIRMGAAYPNTGKVKTGKEVMEDRKNHWAFKKPRKPSVPSVKGAWHPIDRFVQKKLREKGLKQSPPADRRTLIRRTFFDLVGLPPSANQLEDYVSRKGDWYGRMLDELLGSDRYGERWARHWLDVMRYSDSKGSVNGNRDMPDYNFAYTYRDYVIEAFNRDKPYDQFIMEQLAVNYEELKVNANRKQLLPALGFITLGQRFGNNRHDIIDDRIDTTSKAFLGLTVACARCHDHKFDPIPTQDYYSWYSIFANLREPKDTEEPVIEEGKARFLNDYRSMLAPLMAEYKRLDGLLKLPGKEKKRRGLTREKIRDISRDFGRNIRKINDLRNVHPGTDVRAHVVYDQQKPREYKVFNLGDPKSPGIDAPRRFLDVLSQGKKRKTYENGSGRYELARDIASKDNPLTARVMVNRIWKHHFDSPFVLTPDDFGVQSEDPVNQELLDHLAVYFMENGWSIKKLHRYIMTSNTYKQQSAYNARNSNIDPNNRYYWKQNVKRLEFEAIRDSILHIGEFLDNRLYGLPGSLNTSRRSIYARVDRRNLEETMFHFDFANPSMATGIRQQTTVPLQALFMMNSPFVIEQVKRLCDMRKFKKMETTNKRLDFLYERIYQRMPTSAERMVAALFIEASPDDGYTVQLRNKENIKNAKTSIAKAKNLQKKNDEGKVREFSNQLRSGMSGGRFVARAPLIRWEKLAHSMMMANEMFYVH